MDFARATGDYADAVKMAKLCFYTHFNIENQAVVNVGSQFSNKETLEHLLRKQNESQVWAKSAYLQYRWSQMLQLYSIVQPEDTTWNLSTLKFPSFKREGTRRAFTHTHFEDPWWLIHCATSSYIMFRNPQLVEWSIDIVQRWQPDTRLVLELTVCLLQIASSQLTFPLQRWI